MRIHLILGISLALTAGCASKPSVAEHQCRAGDWYTVGFRDGSRGFESTQLLRHQEACGEHGIYLEREEYMTGWDEGLAEFCTMDNAFDLGRRGAGHRGLCGREFDSAYDEGRQLYQAGRAVISLEREIAGVEQRLVDLRQEIIGATTAQLTPDLTYQQRVALLTKVEALHNERTRLTLELPELEAELEHSRQHLDELTQSLAYGY